MMWSNGRLEPDCRKVKFYNQFRKQYFEDPYKVKGYLSWEKLNKPARKMVGCG